MLIGVPRETFSLERRVSITPATADSLAKLGAKVVVETGAGENAGFPDDAYRAKGVEVAASRPQVFETSDVVVQVRTYAANAESGEPDLALLRRGQILIGAAEPLTAGREIERIAATGAILFANELLPRITRAQSMDTLSSMATIAGYKAALLAADTLPKMFPLMMTAAGTVAPARVLVLGAGVAGLQAIATCKRLGAVVSSYDVRSAVKEQVESLGAKFVELDLETGSSEDAGGYAKELGEEFYRRQREAMKKVIAEHDVVITTAAIPGKKAPILVTEEMVGAMRPRSLVVDLAAERGGNCELTSPGESVERLGVTILGPLNIAAAVPYHASQMYAQNMANFMKLMIKDGAVSIDTEDEILRETLVTKDGVIVNARVLEALAAAGGNA